MESSKVDMEASNQSSGSSELNNSWIILESDEASVPSGDLKNETEKVDPVVEIASFKETAQIMVDYTNNKSDGESDGISIISESEFYNGSDDDNSNSSDDNAYDNTKKLTTSHDDDFQKSEDFFGTKNSNISATPSEISCSFEEPSSDGDFTTRRIMTNDENPVKKPEIEDISFVDNNEVLTDQSMTLCDIPRQPGRSTVGQDNTNQHNDKKLENSESTNIFTQFNVICIIGSILFALLASHISSESNKNSKLRSEKPMQNDQKLKYRDDVYDYCSDLYAPYHYNNEGIKNCVQKITRRLETDKTFKLSDMIAAGQQYSRVEDDDISSAKCRELIAKRYPERIKNRQLYEDVENYETIKSKPKTNEKFKRFQKSIKYNKKRKPTFNNNEGIDNLGERLDHEKKALNKWKKHLKRTEKKLIDWEKTLIEREKNLIDERKNFQFRTSDPKEKDIFEMNKKNYRFNNKEKYKYEKYKSTKQLKKKYKDKTPQSPNRNYKQMKNKLHQIPVQKLKVIYNAKKNETNTLHDNQITGEWYINLSQSRNDLRKEDGKASWWFDRANFRKLKRDKAHWYFQYMINREDLRYHKNF